MVSCRLLPMGSGRYHPIVKRIPSSRVEITLLGHTCSLSSALRTIHMRIPIVSIIPTSLQGALRSPRFILRFSGIVSFVTRLCHGLPGAGGLSFDLFDVLLYLLRFGKARSKRLYHPSLVHQCSCLREKTYQAWDLRMDVLYDEVRLSHLPCLLGRLETRSCILTLNAKHRKQSAMDAGYPLTELL